MDLKWRIAMKKIFSLLLCFSTLLFMFGCSNGAGSQAKYEYKKGDKIKEVIPCKYDYAGDFSDGLAEVKLNGKYGFIDKTGKEVVLCKYDDVWESSEGLARVELDGKWGCIDKTGKEIMPFIYDFIGDFSEGLAYVKKDEKYGYISYLSN